MAAAASYRFGPFVVDQTAYRLTNGGAPVEVSPKTFDLLVLFCSRPGELVTKDDMLAALWPGIAVTDNALTQVVSELRQALGDHPSAPTYVQTVPRRGYRFIAKVTRAAAAPAEPAWHAAREGGADASSAVLPDAPRKGTRSIAVPDFVNVSNDSDVAWLSAGIAETVTNDLRAIAGLRVIDRGLLAKPDRSRDKAAAVDGGGADAAGPHTLVAARSAGLDLIVAGSFQRAGDRLRINARVLDVQTRESVATAKADGTLEDVFAVQDALVTSLVAGLQLTMTPAAVARIRTRETSSLDAYRALTEGRLKLETLEMADVPGALADFERALALDPDYAMAHVGMAHAQFWRFQASRARTRPDREALGSALAHARRAVEIDPELAEGHAALALFLAGADRAREAIVAGRIALALEPGNWRHQFRLGMAEWGAARLDCLNAVIAQFPAFAYAPFGAAMVLVARGTLADAEAVLNRGIQSQSSGAGAGRFPPRGLHWLLGLVHLSAGRAAAAAAEFDREIASTSRGMLAEEFLMDAYAGLGFVQLAAGDAASATTLFHQALEHCPGHPRSLIGLADSETRAGHAGRAAAAMRTASAGIDELALSGRHNEAAMSRAYWLVVAGKPAEARHTLERLLDQAPPGPAGWTIPIEPWLAAERGTPMFAPVLERLAARAR